MTITLAQLLNKHNLTIVDGKFTPHPGYERSACLSNLFTEFRYINNNLALNKRSECLKNALDYLKQMQNWALDEDKYFEKYLNEIDQFDVISNKFAKLLPSDQQSEINLDL